MWFVSEFVDFFFFFVSECTEYDNLFIGVMFFSVGIWILELELS